MTQENKNRLLGLLQQHKELGIAEQIDFDKSMTDSPDFITFLRQHIAENENQ